MIRKIFITLFCISFAVISAGCGEKIIINGKAYSVLSQEEEQQMLLFARLTLVNSWNKPYTKSLMVKPQKDTTPQENKNITQAQKDFIMNTMPEIKLFYTGDKSGRASYEWIFDDTVMFKVNCDGRFLTDSMNVNARKINLKEIIEKGKSPALERLTFKEIK